MYSYHSDIIADSCFLNLPNLFDKLTKLQSWSLIIGKNAKLRQVYVIFTGAKMS